MMNAAYSEFNGNWRATYWYPSNSVPGTEESTSYDGEIEQVGNVLIFECPKDADGSYLFVRMSVDVDLVTGTWQENTAPSGEFAGAIYSGAFQLLLSADRQGMDGMWVGNGQDNGVTSIYTGKWWFERLPA